MTTQSYFGWIPTFALALLSAGSVIGAPSETDSIPPAESYTNSLHRWSISFPSGWRIDNRNLNFVVALGPSGGACAIYTGNFPFKFTTVDEFTDSLLAEVERRSEERGSPVFVNQSRQRISLVNGIVGNDVLRESREALPMRSRQVHVVAEGRAFVIDCETWASNWGRLELIYDRIIRSFTLGK